MTNADATVALDERERAIINAFQGGFPVVERPFEPAARALAERGIEITADELLDEIRRLDEEGTLSRFGALIDAEAIGGTATLVAMHAPEERFDEIAEQVNAHREVAHNYEREHPHLNMWFVVSVAGEARSASDASGGTASENVEGVLTAIENETGQETYNLPKQREFRVEAKFLLDGPISDGDLDLSELGPDVEPSGRGSLTPAERDLVIELQGGLPLTETPYADVADAIGHDVEWVVETINRFLAEGKLRRVGVVPNHYALGYTENGMTVWDVPDELVAEVGPAIAELEFVTHCYERPRHEGVWPYDFFAMTHGRSEEESERRIEQVRERMGDFFDVGDEDWDTLFSTRILKKTGIRMDERAAANTDAASEENEL
ncbi:Lrp/AsnC family transcriptional regulator [Halococcus dombrowskii]|uniref:siroheme decarboxylase n=1 Tax=Halococcus dombrowskii TaxID=179637 RepID=A0AAV3SHY2_HALDO|nr:Lrp/AsnC family transcriptional regulator [Halococcus dombrowskii]UOO94791.1 Lrp/AsnC family transcriptional regulator [Halococcus dombrowskii]